MSMGYLLNNSVLGLHFTNKQITNKWYASSRKAHGQFGLAIKLQRNNSELKIQLCHNRVWAVFKHHFPMER